MPAHSAPGSSSGSETGTVALGSSAHVGCRRPRRVGSVHAAPAPWPSDQTQASTSVPGTAFPRVWPVPPGNRRDQWTHFHLAPVGKPTVSPRLSRGSLRPGEATPHTFTSVTLFCFGCFRLWCPGPRRHTPRAPPAHRGPTREASPGLQALEWRRENQQAWRACPLGFPDGPREMNQPAPPSPGGRRSCVTLRRGLST